MKVCILTTSLTAFPSGPNQTGAAGRSNEGDQVTSRLKSAVTKRKGRGFSSAASALPSVVHFDSLQEESSGNALRSIEGWVLFVAGLHEECTEDDILDRFGDFGRVREIKVNLDHRTGYVKGYALVEFESYVEARAALETLNGSEFMDGRLAVDFAFVKAPVVK